MPPPAYSTPALPRAVRPPTTRMTPRPIIPRVPTTLGSAGPTRESAPARSLSTVPVSAIRSTPPTANASQRLDSGRAPAPATNLNLTPEDYDGLPTHMIKPAPPRTFRELLCPEAANRSAHESAPSVASSTTVEAHRSAITAQSRGEVPFVGYYQAESSRDTVTIAQSGGEVPSVGYQAEPSGETVAITQGGADVPFVGYYQDDPPRTTATLARNGGDVPVVGYYQAEPSRDTVTIAQSGGDVPFVGYYQNDPPSTTTASIENGSDVPFVGYYQDDPPRTTTNATAVANASAASAPMARFYQSEAVLPTVSERAVQNTTSVASLSQSQPRVVPAQNSPAEPLVFAHADPDAPDLMDIDVEDPLPSIPAWGTIELHNREQAPATTGAFPGLSNTRVGNRDGHGAVNNLPMEIADTKKQPEQKCTCIKKPRGLGSSRWADPAPEQQSRFVPPSNGTPAECPVHNPRPVTLFTPTAPEFVPRSGTRVPPVGGTLTPEVPGRTSGQVWPTPTPRTPTLRSPAFQVPSGDEKP